MNPINTTLFFVIAIIGIAIIGTISFLIIYQPINVETNMPITITVKMENESSQSILLPVTITQKFSKNYELTGLISAEKILIESSVTDSVDSHTVSITPIFDVVDRNQNDVIDSTRLPNGLLSLTVPGSSYAVRCQDNVEKRAHFGIGVRIPIKNVDSDIFVRYLDSALNPDDDGIYYLRFSSYFPTNIELPSDAIILSNNMEICSTIGDFRTSQISIYDISFRL
ncbi:MAG: hypothetical protein HW410_1738 [Nitrosarchaeum sp.]|nr:hypothetical protein [Nitrosarchaeum sp.]